MRERRPLLGVLQGGDARLAARDKEADPLKAAGEAGQDEGVPGRSLGRRSLLDLCLCLCRGGEEGRGNKGAKGVADVDDFADGCVEGVGRVGALEETGEGLEDGDLRGELDLGNGRGSAVVTKVAMFLSATFSSLKRPPEQRIRSGHTGLNCPIRDDHRRIRSSPHLERAEQSCSARSQERRGSNN